MPEPSIPREVLTRIPRLQKDIVTIIQGVRRSGKSTLLSQIMMDQSLDPQACFYVNFEDPRLTDRLNPELLDSIVELANTKIPKGAHYFFFDEIQNVEQWQKWFHTKLERPQNDHFIVTGSNATLLTGKIATALTGRHITTEVFPFSYGEFREISPASSFEDYLSHGGFPRVASFEAKYQLLREYFTDIIERDVKRNLLLKSSTVIAQLVKSVYESTGSELSQRSLAIHLGIAPDTAGVYLAECEAAYAICRCPYFTFSERKRLVRNKKYYPIDVGLRNAVITKGGKDRGKELETVVFLHLKKRFRDVFYWRGHGEIDFVVHDGNRIVPIQVSWDGMKARHKEAYLEFKEEYPQSDDLISVTRENVESFIL